MKNFKLIIGLVVFASMFSCNDKKTRQLQYMPDMYESIPYKADGAKGLGGNPVNRAPVAGTLNRGGTPEGSIYHILIHGKGLMGSHTSQLTYNERWQIIQYVEVLRADLLK